MSKHKQPNQSADKIKLPDRLYYRLADAAQLLECPTDDLLHFGVCGYLEILASVDFQYAVGSVFDQSRAESIFATERFFSFDFFAFSRADLKEMERTGEARASRASNLYLSVGSKLRRAVPTVSGKVKLLEETDASQLPGDYFSWVFPDGSEKANIGDPLYPDVQKNYYLKMLKITPENLWVRTKELRRFEKEGASRVLIDPVPPDIQEKPIGITERNKTLAIIAALAAEAGIDVYARGASVEIARITEAFGAAVSDDAIRGRLKGVSEALESFKK